jgi:hypothetical protein
MAIFTYKSPSTHWIGGWVDPRAGPGDMEKFKFLTLPGLELRPLGHPTRGQSLYRLNYWSSTCVKTYSLQLQQTENWSAVSHGHETWHLSLRKSRDPDRAETRERKCGNLPSSATGSIRLAGHAECTLAISKKWVQNVRYPQQMRQRRRPSHRGNQRKFLLWSWPNSMLVHH